MVQVHGEVALAVGFIHPASSSQHVAFRNAMPFSSSMLAEGCRKYSAGLTLGSCPTSRQPSFMNGDCRRCKNPTTQDLDGQAFMIHA